MPNYFRCSTCGMVWPADYIERWGRDYGHGLGSRPVCEALQTNYDAKIAVPDFDPAGASHPVGVCKGEIIPFTSEKKLETGIRAIDDPFMTKRMAIIREKQKESSPAMKAHFAAIKS